MVYKPVVGKGERRLWFLVEDHHCFFEEGGFPSIVIVEDGEELAVGMGEAVGKVGEVTDIHWMAEVGYPGIATNGFCNDISRLVAGGVVTDEQRPGTIGLGKDAGDSLSAELGAIVRGNENTDARSQRQELSSAAEGLSRYWAAIPAQAYHAGRSVESAVSLAPER